MQLLEVVMKCHFTGPALVEVGRGRNFCCRRIHTVTSAVWAHAIAKWRERLDLALQSDTTVHLSALTDTLTPYPGQKAPWEPRGHLLILWDSMR